MVHDGNRDPDPAEMLGWLDSGGLDSLTESLLAEGEITGVSRDRLPYYMKELRAILGIHFQPAAEPNPTARVIRSKHVLWIVRENPFIFPHLAALSDREVLRVASMILRDMRQEVLNNKNRGKFLVTTQGMV